MNDSFAESRQALRSLLGVSGVPIEATGWAPRSRLMRAVLNPGNRRVVLAVASLATLAFPRITRAGAFYPLVKKLLRFRK